MNHVLSGTHHRLTELALDDVAKGTSIEDNLHEVYAAGKRAKDLVKPIIKKRKVDGRRQKN